MSSAASATKKRKKSDNKPQAQLNKCLNEKRRREQENIYIEELAELISASFADMSSLSVKPDKCAILQETVTQIRKIKEQERNEREAVQQGEVSSSRPGVLTNEVFGPLLLEALEGFLFVVNSDGRVVYVTENVSQFIKYTKDEVMGMTIYNLLHVGDHARFAASLRPVWAGATAASATTDPSPRSRTFNSRLLVKPPDDASMEQKQQRVSKYENMQISCTQLSYSGSGGGDDDEGEGGPCLMCVARRIPANEKQLGAPIEQFTTKLDASGLIMDVDASGVSTVHAPLVGKELKGRSLKDLCHSADLVKLTNHLKETIHSTTSTSPIYRLRVGHDKVIHVQTKSKFFKGKESDFIMATHSIIGDNDVAVAEHTIGSMGSGSSSGGVGGPLISSVNGGGRPLSELNNTITLNNSTTLHSVTLTTSELSFDFDFPTTTWNELGTEERNVWPGTPPSQSPFYTGQPGPPAYPFSPLGAPDPATAEPPDQESEGPGEGDAQKLRDLLTRKASAESDSENRSHEVLKDLLRDTEDQNSDAQQSSQPANNMLLRLLNDKSDDDDLETKAGLKKQSELLHHLLKEEENQEEPGSGMSPERVRKRPSSEEEDSRGKRALLDRAQEQANQSKLWEKNKMLAQLLSQQPTTPTRIPPIPESVITATPQDKMERLKQQPVPTSAPSGIPTTASAAAASWAAARAGRRPVPPQWEQSDPVLSDLLDQVIDIAPDAVAESPVLMHGMDGRMGPGNIALCQELMTERLAISAIQKSLEQCETVVSGPPYSQPSTPLSAPQVGSGQQQQFPPPPLYQQRTKFTNQMPNSGVTPQQRQNTQFMQQVLIQRNRAMAIEHTKQRLLQQQQQQQLLIPSSAASAPVDPNIHNIGSLINDSVAPNVALQRSGSVGEAQLSPAGGYGGNRGGAGVTGGQGGLMGSSPQLSPAQPQPRQPYSPQPFSPVSYQGQGGQPAGGGPPQGAQQARLSPSGLSSYQAQLSPRVSQGQQSFAQQSTTWSQQQASRLSLQQQQNPMLNAQLAAGNGTVGAGRFQALPPVRSLTSPGARQSPFPPELSPTSASGYQFRRGLQPPTTQLPGGNNGMTEYVRQELRAVLGARTTVQPRQPHDPHLEELGLPFDIPQSVNDSPKMWGDMSGGSPQPGASPLTPRNPVEEASRTNEQKSSLLQKLLSE